MTDWLDITGLAPEKPKRKRKPKRKTREARIEAAVKLPNETRRAQAMIKKLNGTSRVWSCDGEFVYYRPTRMIAGVKTEVANPTAKARHARFLAEGQYTYLATQDDVEIYRVNESSPFARKGFFLGELKDSDVRRHTALAACRRDWVAYVDCLEELAGRIKGRYDPAQARLIYEDQLTYLANLIQMRGGPSSAECAAGLANVRQRRGVGSGRLIMLPQGRAA